MMSKLLVSWFDLCICSIMSLLVIFPTASSGNKNKIKLFIKAYKALYGKKFIKIYSKVFLEWDMFFLITRVYLFPR